MRHAGGHRHDPGRRPFDRAAADRVLVLGFRVPFPGLGRIRVIGGRYAWVPAPWRFQG